MDLAFRPADEFRPSEDKEKAHRALYEKEEYDKDEFPPVFEHAVEEGCFEGVPNELYQAHPAISRSMLKAYAECPAHFGHDLATREAWEVEEDDFSRAQNIGTAVHAFALEPERAEEVYKKAPETCSAVKGSGDKCTNPPKGFYTDKDPDGEFLCGVHSRGRDPDEGVEVLDEETFGIVTGMVEAMKEDPEASRLLFEEPGVSEASLVAVHDRGVPLRARPDRISYDEESGTYTITDIKTCTGDSRSSARSSEVVRQMGRLGYWMQVAFYPMVFEILFGVRPEFRFVFVEKRPPHVVQVYEFDALLEQKAWARIDEMLWEVGDCLDLGDFPAYTTHDVQVVGMKKWDLERYGLA
jgi:hypothetical protein